MPLFKYALYGLTVVVNRRVEGLRPTTSSKIDVHFQVGALPGHLNVVCDDDWDGISSVTTASGEPAFKVAWLEDARFFQVSYAAGDTFVYAADGRKVWCSLAGGRDASHLAIYLSGPIGTILMRLRGTVCLHASVVSIGGRAVAFAGASGSGKSTLAAAFARRGHPVLSDDLAALSSENEVCVPPGPVRIRLWSESVEALFGDCDPLPRLASDWPKQYADASQEVPFQEEAQPLSGVFFLNSRDSRPAGERISRMGERDSFLRLLGTTHASWVTRRAGRRKEFDVLSRLATTVPCYEVVPHTEIAKIGDLCQQILDKVSALQK